MKGTIWYGISQKENTVQFFDRREVYDQSKGNLKGTGSFTIDGEVNGLDLQQQAHQQQGGDPVRG